jgi:hypothetical protein
MALSVVELLIGTEVPTVPLVSVGVVPSSVYRTVAPAVAVLIVTLGAQYVPQGGENVGAATVGGLFSMAMTLVPSRIYSLEGAVWALVPVARTQKQNKNQAPSLIQGRI